MENETIQQITNIPMRKVVIAQQGKLFWLIIQHEDREPVYLKVQSKVVDWVAEQLNIEIIKI
jgi:hypothetical protein